MSAPAEGLPVWGGFETKKYKTISKTCLKILFKNFVRKLRSHFAFKITTNLIQIIEISLSFYDLQQNNGVLLSNICHLNSLE